MSIKSIIAQWIARKAIHRIEKQSANAILDQKKWFELLLNAGKKIAYGTEKGFSNYEGYTEYSLGHPIQHYEDFIPYIERIKGGEKDVLWKGLPLYFAKTSGTTAGAKYIPISHESMPHHIAAARNALLCYIAKSGNSDFVSGKMIFLQGSPVLDYLPSGIAVGRLSGIVAHHIPGYLQKNRLPKFETNSIEDWEIKVNAIADETIPQDMRLISGIPSWVQMYFEILIQKTGKPNIKQIFPHFSLFVFGGVHFEPYRKRMQELIGGPVDIVETFPASEGFFAYQDDYEKDDLLLNTNAGIFYEFVKSHEYFDEKPKRYPLWEVEKDTQYALIITTNAGLWSYSIGDTIKFTQLNPFRIKVTGRIKHYTSAFGEHVIAEEVEKAITSTMEQFQFAIDEFHVAPKIDTANELPHHEWWIESQHVPESATAIAEYLDAQMVAQNIYYKDLIAGKVLQPLKIQWVKPGTFHGAMKKQGKLGGQNKMPRLSNDRIFADLLTSS
jgi:hypothetical protein